MRVRRYLRHTALREGPGTPWTGCRRSRAFRRSAVVPSCQSHQGAPTARTHHYSDVQRRGIRCASDVRPKATLLAVRLLAARDSGDTAVADAVILPSSDGSGRPRVRGWITSPVVPARARPTSHRQRCHEDPRPSARCNDTAPSPSLGFQVCISSAEAASCD